MAHKFHEVVTTPAVLREQERYYGRGRPIPPAANDPLGPREAQFIAARDSFYMATVSASGWPYLQHRGGPSGFLRALGPTQLAFADYEGNHQMISTGNLAGDDRVALFLMDYPNQRRLKVLGHARVVDAREAPELVGQMGEPEADATVERVYLIDVVSFDWNCPQHITQRYTADEVAAAVEPLHREIAALRARLGEKETAPAS